MKYKLNYFSLNKQSLKRKFKNIHSSVNIKKLKVLLDQKETSYNLTDIKYIVNTIYNNLKVNNDEPLSVYYKKKNRKKFKDLIDLIEIEEDGHVYSKIDRDVKELHQKSIENIYDMKKLKEKQLEISKKYSVKMTQIENIFNDFETKWVENFIK